MKNVFILLVSFFASSLMAQAPASEGSDQSSITWIGKKVTGEHTGTLQLQSVDLDIADGVLQGGSFTADMTSIKVTDLTGEYAQKLEGHLKSDDFFGTDNFPTAKFTITNVEATDAGGYNVTGDMTIKGITHPVSFTTTLNNGLAKADIKVDRTKYNVKYGSGSFFDGLGDKMIYDDFEISVQLAY